MCLTDIYYLFKHWRNRQICPRCGNKAFEHGWFPDEEYYCAKCHLWEPDWEKQKKMVNKIE